MIQIPECYEKQAVKKFRGASLSERIEHLADIWLKTGSVNFEASDDKFSSVSENKKRFIWGELWTSGAFQVFFLRNDLTLLRHLCDNHYPVLYDIAKRAGDSTMMDFAAYATIELKNALDGQ